MLAVDTNILVYAHRRETPEHEPASALLKNMAQGTDAWAIPWPCIFEFFGVVTNRRIWRDVASSQRQAWRQIDGWLLSPTVRLLCETDDFRPILETFVMRRGVLGAVVHDARVAAICSAHGVEALLTRDRDFALFPELECRDPFAAH